jgi:integrase
MFRFMTTRPEDGQRVEGKLMVGPVRLFPSQGAAWQEVQRLRLHQQINRPTISTKRTFGDLARHYEQHELDDQKPNSRLAHSTMFTYRLNLNRHILSRWRDISILEMKPLDIERWLHSLELENPTKDKIRRVMDVVLKHAQKHDLLGVDFKNPIQLVSIPTTSKYKPIVVTPSQAFKILMALPQFERTLTLLIAATGLRISEALGLQWRDVEYVNDQIVVCRTWLRGEIGDPKTVASGAPVAMGLVLAQYMREWHKATPYARPTDWVFASSKMKGKQPRVSNMLASDHLRPAAIAAGVKIADGQRFGFHNLRHSLATFLVTKAKTDPKTVQAMLRHANVKTTLDLYTQSMSDDKLAAQGQVLDAIFEFGQNLA